MWSATPWSRTSSALTTTRSQPAAGGLPPLPCPSPPGAAGDPFDPACAMIAIANRQKRCPVDRRRLRRSLQRLLKALGRPEAELSVVLVDDEQIREINRST